MAFVDDVGLWCCGLFARLLQWPDKEFFTGQLEQSCLQRRETVICFLLISLRVSKSARLKWCFHLPNFQRGQSAGQLVISVTYKQGWKWINHHFLSFLLSPFSLKHLNDCSLQSDLCASLRSCSLVSIFCAN